MIRLNDVHYAEKLVESIKYALANIKNNAEKYGDESVSKTESFYLSEKISKLYDLHFDEDHRKGE